MNIRKLVRHKLAGNGNLDYKNHTNRHFGPVEEGEHLTLLVNKLKEEAWEVGNELLKDTIDRDALIEELADIYDVLDAIKVKLEVNVIDVVLVRAEKARKKGDFLTPIVYSADVADDEEASKYV